MYKNKFLYAFIRPKFFNMSALYLLKIINAILDKILGGIVKKNTRSYITSGDPGYQPKNKILFLIPNLGAGGSERQLVNIANFLTDKENAMNFGNLEVIIGCLRSSLYPNDFYQSRLNRTIKVIYLGDGIGVKSYLKSLSNNMQFFWMGKNLVLLERINKLIELEKPRILHAWLDSPSVYGGLAGVKSNIPVIVLATRSLNPTHFFSNRFYFKSMMRTFAGFNKVNFVNNSLVGAKDYENWLNLKPGTIKVIYNGYNIKDFNNIPLQIYNSKPALVGGVMRFNSEKNVKLWVESAACLISRGANVRFILIGDGIERPAIEKLIANLGLSDKFFLMKPIREVYTVMSEFNVLLLTSRHEGLPNVLIEAQLLGVPVVSTNAGGASETFIDKVSGYLVEVNDPERIADCLFEIITNKDLAKRFSRYAKRHSSHRFSISSTIEQYANIYGSLNES